MTATALVLLAFNAHALTPEQVFKRCSPAVVVVEVTLQNGTGVQGSGFNIGAEGLVLTNFHVIEEAKSVEVTFPDGQRFSVGPLPDAQSKGWDLALFVIPLPVSGSHKLPTIPVRRRGDPSPGSYICALGSPLGLTNTISEGLVSGVRPNGNCYIIQTSAAISKGSSGGPCWMRSAQPLV